MTDPEFRIERSAAGLSRAAVEAALGALADAPALAPPGERMSIGFLRECLIAFTDLNGAWGSNLHESKEVLLRVHGHVFALKQVAASFYQGRFVIVRGRRQRAR